ncbi:hypothetical protein PENTCL1PPCAC_23876, partial [Pristionchus entomophagus]
QPDSISQINWQMFRKFGNTLADLVLDALAVYASGDFASWDKQQEKTMLQKPRNITGEEAENWRNHVCKYIVVERMKEKEFFCCKLCQEAPYNYKQALIHFTSFEH